MPNFLSVEHFPDKILKLKLGMKNSVENLLDFILRGNSTDQRKVPQTVQIQKIE